MGLANWPKACGSCVKYGASADEETKNKLSIQAGT
jgi:hypothetical protein